MAKQIMTLKETATYLGVTPGWIKQQTTAGNVKPRKGRGKHAGRPVFGKKERDALKDIWTRAPIPEVEPASDLPIDELPPAVGTLLARFSDLEAERANLLAQIAWERALAREREKALELEQLRSRQLAEEVGVQRTRIEALKALSLWDRVRGRHKSI